MHGSRLRLTDIDFLKVHHQYTTADRRMTTPPLEVLYEDNHLLVVNKPAGLPTMGTPDGTPTLLTLAKDYIKRRCRKPGNVYWA